MSLPLRITFEQEYGDRRMELHVQAGHIRMEIEIPDASRPVPLGPDDRVIMLTIRSALLGAGAPRGMLTGTYGSYFLWCLAQHVKYTMEAEGPTVELAGINLARTLPLPSPGLPRLSAIVVPTGVWHEDRDDGQPPRGFYVPH